MQQSEKSMTDHWTAQDAAKQAEDRMNVAEAKLKERKFLEARTELNLALFNLKKAEEMAEKAGEILLGIHRARYNGLVLKLRWRDHLLNLLGM